MAVEPRIGVVSHRVKAASGHKVRADNSHSMANRKDSRHREGGLRRGSHQVVTEGLAGANF